MDSTIAPRDWRKAKPGTHTKEVTRETIPQDVQELLLEMVNKLRHLETEVFELKATVGAFGSVTLNDLMRKTA
jgi:hypothetical protein